jgi:hypothetical protein
MARRPRRRSPFLRILPTAMWMRPWFAQLWPISLKTLYWPGGAIQSIEPVVTQKKRLHKEVTFVEAELLKQKQLPLLPIIAPDQATLAGDEPQGLALAAESVEILLRLLRGAGKAVGPASILVFLDVEGDKSPISDVFLLGWCKGAERGQRRPGSSFFRAFTPLPSARSVRGGPWRA